MRQKVKRGKRWVLHNDYRLWAASTERAQYTWTDFKAHNKAFFELFFRLNELLLVIFWTFFSLNLFPKFFSLNFPGNFSQWKHENVCGVWIFFLENTISSTLCAVFVIFYDFSLSLSSSRRFMLFFLLRSFLVIHTILWISLRAFLTYSNVNHSNVDLRWMNKIYLKEKQYFISFGGLCWIDLFEKT